MLQLTSRGMQFIDERERNREPTERGPQPHPILPRPRQSGARRRAFIRECDTIRFITLLLRLGQKQLAGLPKVGRECLYREHICREYVI